MHAGAHRMVNGECLKESKKYLCERGVCGKREACGRVMINEGQPINK